MPNISLNIENGELVLEWVSEPLALVAEPLAKSICAMIQGGSVFEEGQTIEIGISRAKIEADGPGRLVVGELDAALGALLLMGYTCRSYAIEETAVPSSAELVTVCTHYRATNEFKMERGRPLFERDSGWSVACGGGKHEVHNHDDESAWKRIDFTELSVGRPAVVKFLGLPSGAYVDHWAGLVPRVSVDGHRRSLVEGSYIDGCYSRSSFDIDDTIDSDIVQALDERYPPSSIEDQLAERHSLAHEVARAAVKQCKKRRALARLTALGLSDAIAEHAPGLRSTVGRARDDVLKALRVRTRKPVADLEIYAELILRASAD